MPLERDFTLTAYVRLLRAMQKSGLPLCGVLQWMQHPPVEGVVVRHDVDRRPSNALAMALAEAELGLRTTYYFRTVGSSLNPLVIQKIASLGHEIGYHYEDLALAKGNVGRALELFSEHLTHLRTIAPIATIAMHGSPLSRWNNLDLWSHSDFTRFGIEGEALLSIDYEQCVYLTDTGRSWNAGNTNLRDRPKGAYLLPDGVNDTASLMKLVESGGFRRIAMSVHPERWDKHLSGWLYQLSKDRAVNGIKRLIALTRGARKDIAATGEGG